MAGSSQIGAGFGVGRGILGREKGRRERGRRKRKREERKREKENFRVCSGFQNPILYFPRFFRTKFYFCVFFIVFSIFNKYNAKINF